ncbi:MAG: OsmC family peroxiredoxin, partial [Anaerolineaceae bacterium]
MADRKAKAKWEGTLREGKGVIKFADYEGPYTYQSRFEEGKGINPEQLIAAAHAGCFTMAFNSALEKAGFLAEEVETEAFVTLGKIGDANRITKIHLVTEAKVSGISEEEFLQLAEGAKVGCPISAALAAVPSITLDA